MKGINVYLKIIAIGKGEIIRNENKEKALSGRKANDAMIIWVGIPKHTEINENVLFDIRQTREGETIIIEKNDK